MLKVNEINVFYGGLQALSNISINVQEKEFIAILGANGAGKSTLLNTIAGLLTPKSGSIFFLGEKIDHLPVHNIVRRGLSLIPEEGWLFPQMSVVENLLMGMCFLENKSRKKEMIKNVFKIFPRLEERKMQQAGLLSGGERQMLVIGRGLIRHPKLLMIDEPSLGIAPKLVIQIFETLREIHKEEKITIILTEQNVYKALELSSRGYVLENGKIVIRDSSKELLKSDVIKKKYLSI